MQCSVWRCGAMWLACWLLVGAATAGGRTQDGWVGRVSRVSDGDTVWVRPLHGGGERKIRMLGIDAPEICQSYGAQARAALAQQIEGQQVRVFTQGRDDYQRWLARLEWQGKDVGGWMVQQGWAWSYQYRDNPGPYVAQEQQARAARRGLFVDARPERPRDFRRRHGSCH